MGQGLEVSGPAGIAVLVLPLLLLILVMILSLRSIARQRPKRAGPDSTGRYGEALPAPPRIEEPARPTAGLERPPPRPVSVSAAEIEDRIRRVEASSTQTDLPSLYLALARERIASGRAAEASQHLTRSLRLSATLGQKEVQASARIELGDLARAGGDLTTACEHWQLARSIFHELKRAGDLAAAEKRMRQNGCPTDWVLTDF
jgi:hypothetical protein